MEATDSVVVSDAGPIIHLDELNCLDLLRDLGAILIPREVWREIKKHRSALDETDVPNARVVDVHSSASAQLASLSDSLGLHSGERSALILMESSGAKLLLCDDAAARLAAESMGFAVRGTIGVIVRSARQGQRTRAQVLDLLRNLPAKSTLHLSAQLLEAVIREFQRE